MLRTPAIAAIIAAVALATPQAQAQEKIRPLDCPAGMVRQAECGQLTVPMYYNSTNDKTIDVGFARIPAENPTAKRGTIFINPGGPGSSVYTALATDFYKEFPADMRKEWDIVGVQPRGLITPVICDEPSGTDMISMFTNYGGEIKQACENQTPGYTASLTTEHTARDWEEVRKAMGLTKISIYGLSYGTQLASVYATLFPDQTDKLILDSGYNQSASDDEKIPATVALTHEFFNWVAQHNDRFKLSTTGEEVYDKWAAKVEAESGTVPTMPSPRAKWADVQAETKNLGKVIATGANQQDSPTFQWTTVLMTDNRTWHEATKLINGEWSISDAEAAHPLVAEYTDPTPEMQNAKFMPILLSCNERTNTDKPWLLPAAIWTALTGNFLSSNFASGTGMGCKGIDTVTAFPAITGDKLNHQPLQIQALRDPTAPYESGMVMQRKMGSHLISVDNTNHGHLTSNPAVQQAVVEYLRTGKTDVTTIPQPELRWINSTSHSIEHWYQVLKANTSAQYAAI